VNVCREEGVSGTKESVGRPAWSELITALHANGVQVIIIEKLDRLARDLMVQETIYRCGPFSRSSAAPSPS
jgi:DNA invertase Pin-like site-specific DNA recombinase